MAHDYEKSNEALAILARRACAVVKEKAVDLLLRRNESLIYGSALTYWNHVRNSDIDRSLTLDDLVQLGRVKSCEALAAFDPLRGTKLTTFMTAVLNNYLIDTIRPGLKEKEGTGGDSHRLDYYEDSEEQLPLIEKTIDPYQNNPELTLLEKERRREIYESLEGCSPREKTYLIYRFGYPEDDEQTKKDTRDHFGLSETRREKLEHQACDHFKENYNELQHKTEESVRRAEHVSAHSDDRSDCGMIIRWI